MAHFGFLTLSVMGHLFPTSALAQELKSRRHRVTFFCFADAREFLQQAGLDIVVVAEDRLPLGYTKRVTETLGKLNGAKGVAYTIDFLSHEATAQFAELPEAIRSAGVDALVLDQFAMGGATVGDYLRIPYVHVAAALMANVESGVPPMNVGLGPGRNPFALMRNCLVLAVVKAGAVSDPGGD